MSFKLYPVKEFLEDRLSSDDLSAVMKMIEEMSMDSWQVGFDEGYDRAYKQASEDFTNKLD